ncbi:hypothetical protein [Planctomicrobium piriforme]|uniref:MJ0042 family finger-like domain-containing protein n=1 Tax=Planctomicrobium piriforme TaxID=1576369 RepID=A0A1I3FYP4_9PLAN|nr:hypothetical protein [Planctomicrobium piriforme]SFI16350.1 hypothetical protein SAMN05421753_10695 [Planctomicrobium piriforme]
MSIRAVCPECQQVYKVADEKAGKRFQCKQCSGVVTIPAVAGVAVVPQAVAPVKKPVKKPMTTVAAPVAVEVEEPAVASPAKKKKKKTAPAAGKSSFGLSTLLMTYQRAFDFQGRSNRTEYFNFLLSVFWCKSLLS